MDSSHDTTLVFEQESEFKNHMNAHHAQQFHKDELDDFAAVCFERFTSTNILTECPLCPVGQQEELLAAQKDLTGHVAEHLISIAQISLAGHYEEGTGQSEGPSESRQERSEADSIPGNSGTIAEEMNHEFVGQESDDDGESLSVPMEIPPHAGLEENWEFVWASLQLPKHDHLHDPILQSFISTTER